MPEASGERCFVVEPPVVAGKKQVLNVAVIGDSVAAGVGIGALKDALAGHIASQLSERHQVDVKLSVLAKSGDKIEQLQAAMKRQQTEAYDYVIISIGVNDAKSFKSSGKWSMQLMELMSLIEHKFRPQQILLLAIPPLERFPLLKKPLADVLGFRSSRLNAVTSELQKRASQQFTVVNYQLIPKPSHFTADGFHPNETASMAIAKTIVDNYLAKPKAR
ncbi:SGNH/GDSL hydrolase family protein [Thalassotalea euphylliae]|uniref:SGNH/GDSL hydrolase family protein n=1 Tax=Thalassotalea euphylliae TaxID=1655234 RepID=UPI0015F29A49|nr:SGNH/GDSL hydrolase family protein [Thalassotalea euphylliae]